MSKKKKQKNSGDFDKFFEAKTNRLKLEDTHKRQTHHYKKSIIAILNDKAKTKERGYKTAFVNYALEKVIREEFGDELDKYE